MTAGAPVRLFAAGSLRAALTEIADDFSAATGIRVEARFGPSGLLRAAIEAGEPADLFASADMAHPKALAAAFGGRVKAFATNGLCALAGADLGLGPDNLLDRLLDPKLRLGISTPGADPSGDYALELFHRADALRPGSAMLLDAKALRLTGDSLAEPRPRNDYAAILGSRRADVLLTYRSNAFAACRTLPGLALVDTPPELAVQATYGLMASAGSGEALADTILSTRGIAVLERNGFGAATITDLSGQNAGRQAFAAARGKASGMQPMSCCVRRAQDGAHK